MGALSALIVLVENALYPFRVLNAYFGRFFNRILGKRAFSLTLAGKIWLAFLICFVLFITAVLLMHCFFGSRIYRPNELTNSFVLDFILFYFFAFAISIGLYWGVRLATREKPSLYPEIDQCWNAFEKWREKQSLEWHEFSRFLVLGSDLEISKAMHAEMKDKKIGAVPPGANDWMHWFGSIESQYLHLKKVSHINQRLERIKAPSGPGGKINFSPDNTLQASIGVPEWSAEVGAMDATAEVGEYGNSIGDFGGSLDAASSLDAYDTVEMSKSELKEVKAGHESEEDQDFDEDDDSPTERLQYLAKMMQAKTAGEVPFHGVVIAVPFDKFLARENFKTIAAAIKRDLVELREAGEIMFPVSIVFTSMEKDQGFPKLQNLLGSQRATAGRFGAGCRVEDVPVLEKTNLKIQVQKACQSFEDWVINRWAKPSQLARAAQNKELFKLVVRIRQQFKPKLEYLLEEALEWNPSESPDGEGTDLLLAGCYFVSTGQHANDRGFLNGVFLKCQEFAETSSWADSILGRDRVYSVISTLLFLCSILILIGLGIYLYWS